MIFFTHYSNIFLRGSLKIFRRSGKRRISTYEVISVPISYLIVHCDWRNFIWNDSFIFQSWHLFITSAVPNLPVNPVTFLLLYLFDYLIIFFNCETNLSVVYSNEGNALKFAIDVEIWICDYYSPLSISLLPFFSLVDRVPLPQLTTIVLGGRRLIPPRLTEWERSGNFSKRKKNKMSNSKAISASLSRTNRCCTENSCVNFYWTGRTSD